MIPRTLGMATRQINFLAITIIASTLASGSIAIFSFADNSGKYTVRIIKMIFPLLDFEGEIAIVTFINKKKNFIVLFFYFALIWQ